MWSVCIRGAFGGDGNFIYGRSHRASSYYVHSSVWTSGWNCRTGSLVSSVPLILSLLFLADVADIPAVSGNLEEPWADCRRGILLCVSRSFMRSGLYGRNFAGTWCNPPVMEVLMKSLELFEITILK